MIPFEIARYFQPTLIIIILFLSLLALQKWNNMNAGEIIYRNKTNIFILSFFCLLFCIIIGNRPPSGFLFGDTAQYARGFYDAQMYGETLVAEREGEWVFKLITLFCAKYGNLGFYFTVIDIGYVFFAMFGIYRLFKNNAYGGMLFFLGAFSFFTYGTNGLRNGLATSMIILALSFVVTPKKKWIVAIIIGLLALGIHRSVALPIVCFFVAYFIKDPKKAIYFWFFSIFLFLTMRGTIENIFSSIGFDDRLAGYINNSENYAERGLKTGFRPDFLIYSFMPIWLGWFVIKNSYVSNNSTFSLLLKTYIFANSFWVMIMNAAFSNRFAYLSWFLYPIVIAYPCLRMNVWEDKQGQKAGYILLAHTCFTVFMDFIYY